MRYLGAQYGPTCGPIALVNLHKWQGWPVSRQDLPRYVKLCRWGKQAPSESTFRVHVESVADSLSATRNSVSTLRRVALP